MDIDRKLFLEERIGRLLLKFSAPATLGMLAIAICTIADSIFVGQFVGTLGLAATTLALPIFMLFSAISNTIGVGGAAIWSIDMGAKNFERAQKVFGNVLILNFVIGITITSLGLIFLNDILAFLGTPDNVYPYAYTFISFLISGSFFVIFTISTNNFIRAEGKPVTSMLIVFAVALLIIILDTILICIFKMGIMGAALSAISGHLLAFIVISYYFVSGKSKIKITRDTFKPDLSIMKEILNIGMASFLRQFSIGVMHFIVNISVVKYSGVDAGIYLAIVGIGFRIIMFILMPVIGVIQGMQPVIGFNFGAKEYLRAKRAVILAMLGASGIASLAWFVVMIVPSAILAIFSPDADVINYGGNIIRLMICSMPFVAAQTTGAGLYQVLKKPLPANFFAALRQIILLVPIILILPQYFALDGVWYSIPIADFVACIITYVFINREIRWLKNLHLQEVKAT
ncbi:MAG: MATE family efflux transporter [Cyanobacteriota bacterium]